MESGQADVEGLTGAGARVASAWPEANTGLRRLHAFGLIASSILTLLLILCLVLSYGSSSSWPPATAEQRFVAKDLSHSRLIPGVHFVKGSAAHDALQHHRWFVGHFMPAEQLQYSEEVELKWAARKAGESNGEIATNMKARSMNILLHGKIRFEFGVGEDMQVVMLEDEGDYVIWSSGTPHNWFVLEDSTSMTIRWPSLANDQRANVKIA